MKVTLPVTVTLLAGDISSGGAVGHVEVDVEVVVKLMHAVVLVVHPGVFASTRH